MFAVFFVAFLVVAPLVAAFVVDKREKRDAELLDRAFEAVRGLPVSESAPLVASSATPIFDELAVARLRRDLDAWGHDGGAA